MLVSGQSGGVFVAGPLAADEQVELHGGCPVLQLPGACLEHRHLFPQALNPRRVILKAVELLVLVVAAQDLLRQEEDHNDPKAHQRHVPAPLGQPGKHLRPAVRPLRVPPLSLVPGGAAGRHDGCLRSVVVSSSYTTGSAPCSPNCVPTAST